MKKFTFEVSEGILDYSKEKKLSDLSINACRDKFENDRVNAIVLAHDFIKTICLQEKIQYESNYHIIQLEFAEWDSMRWHGSGYWEITISGKEEFIEKLGKVLV